jgi:hypothetical protein
MLFMPSRRKLEMRTPVDNCREILALMEKVRARAKADRGIELEPEVIVLGVDE